MQKVASMTPKKIAFYVEGQTEQLFINKLLIEIAGQKNISIKLRQFATGAKNGYQCNIHPKTTANPVNPMREALIFNCGGDGGVKPRIVEDYTRLCSKGYCEIIGILDLYPKKITASEFCTNLNKGLSNTPTRTEIIVAEREVEAWFLSEHTHFQRIDQQLSTNFIKSNLVASNNKLVNVGSTPSSPFDPSVYKMETLHQPSTDLKAIYQLVGKTYNKEKDKVERTIEVLDYAEIYVSSRQSELKYLIQKIDNFL